MVALLAAVPESDLPDSSSWRLSNWSTDCPFRWGSEKDIKSLNTIVTASIRDNWEEWVKPFLSCPAFVLTPPWKKEVYETDADLGHYYRQVRDIVYRCEYNYSSDGTFGESMHTILTTAHAGYTDDTFLALRAFFKAHRTDKMRAIHIYQTHCVFPLGSVITIQDLVNVMKDITKFYSYRQLRSTKK
jgi:hypothetical protein